MLCQFGKLLYVMVRRLANRLIGECFWYCWFLCVVSWFVNAFLHKKMWNIQNYVFTDSIGNHFTITYRYGTLGNAKRHFQKKTKQTKNFFFFQNMVVSPPILLAVTKGEICGLLQLGSGAMLCHVPTNRNYCCKACTTLMPNKKRTNALERLLTRILEE